MTSIAQSPSKKCRAARTTRHHATTPPRHHATTPPRQFRSCTRSSASCAVRPRRISAPLTRANASFQFVGMKLLDERAGRLRGKSCRLRPRRPFADMLPNVFARACC